MKRKRLFSISEIFVYNTQLVQLKNEIDVCVILEPYTA